MNLARQHSLLVAALLLLASCASVDYYAEPVAAAPHAILAVSKAEFVAAPDFEKRSDVLSIDGLVTRQPGQGEFRIEPGVVTLRARALSSPQVEASAWIEFDAKAGETYVLSTEIGKRHVKFIVEDSTGPLVRAEVEKVFVPEPTLTTVPIYVTTGD